LMRAAEVALGTLKDEPFAPPLDWVHKGAAALSGALGGAGGLGLLAVELPVSTVIMLRSIAAIARSEGHSLRDPRVRLDCLEVFAFGGPTRRDDAAETGYFAVRAAMAAEVTAAVRYVAEHGVADKGAPALVRLLSKIGARFGVAVSEKAAAQAVPIIGAVGGLTVNAVFTDHFQKMAYGHFILRRLEQRYGEDVVRRAYEEEAL
ncbi:MAG: EcsC family protein, partial [Candidatus Dadabacteria bacterium]